MRKTLILLMSFTLVGLAARGVSASTDCQRWLADYKKALAQKANQPKLLAAKHRVRAYAHRTVGQLTTPAPVHPQPTRIANTHPHLTPAQMLKRFELLCGELPVDPTPAVLDARMSPDEFISEMAAAGPVDLDSLPAEGDLVAANESPFYDSPSVNTTTPGGGYSPAYGPVSGGFGAPPSIVTPPGVIPPVAPVPEPSSLVLLLSGSAGLIGVVRRRLA